MKPDTPTRASSRIRAANAAKQEAKASSPSGGGDPTTATGNAASQLSASHGVAPAAGKPPPGAPPPYPSHPTNPTANPTAGRPTAASAAGPVRTKDGRVLPPRNLPAPDPAVLEERKRAALAYAMSDPVSKVGGARGRRKPSTSAGSGSASASGSGAGGAGGGGSASSRIGAGSRVTITGKQAAKGATGSNDKRGAPSTAPPPQFPPAKDLLSDVHAVAAAAERAAAAKKEAVAAPPKRGPGRPRKPPPARPTASKRKVGRPRKTEATHPPHPDSPGVMPAATTKAMANRANANAAANATANANDGEGNGVAGGYGHSGIGAGDNRDTVTAARDLNALAAFSAQQAVQERGGHRVTQSLPSSTRSSATNADNDGVPAGQEEDTPSPSNYHPLPLRNHSDAASVYDDEYARFMRSLMGDDDGSIKTFGTFRTVQSSQSRRSVRSRGEGSTIVGSAFETLDEDDVSYQLTSDEDDDDDDMEEESDEMDEGKEEGTGGATGSPTKRTAQDPLPPTPLPLPHQDVRDEDLFNVLGEIEGLMEEDLEAAVLASLVGGPAEQSHEASAHPGATAGAMVRGMGMTGRPPAPFDPSNKGAVMGSRQQMAITTPGHTTKKKKSTTTVITTPSPLPGGRGGAPAMGARPQAPALEVPAVTADQAARLRRTMARHHQLLLQQATLSVRAAYVQKVRKDGLSAAHHSPVRPVVAHPGAVRRKGDASLPASRLDTRSLTFCARPDAGCAYPNDFYGGETPEELSECLDGSVGMLQDLEQNWKDAVRNSIQLSFQPGQQHQAQGGHSNLGFEHSMQSASNGANVETGGGNNGSRPLTRSAFTKTLLELDREQEMGSGSRSSVPSSSPDKTHLPQSERHYPGRVSVFDIRGLSRLKDTFSALDNSVKDIQMGREKGKNKDGINILAPAKHQQACEALLKHAKAEIDAEYVPGGQADLGEMLTHAPEAFDDPLKVDRPLTERRKEELRRNRHTFTAGEDNLILRGVNLYGEKEWCLVSDRFLPDRAVNSISSRYNKLSYVIYKANGIEIDEKGQLAPVPTYAKGATYDVARAARIRPTRAPTTMNVHRWTLEEDVAILKAVPIMGTAWAEICTKIMPHRDRGHIRKRYQVLQRRLPKGVTKMNMKYLRRPVEQRVKPPRSPRRTKAPRSPAKKRTTKKKAAAGTPAKRISVPAAAPSPANIFQQAAQVHKQLSAAKSAAGFLSSPKRHKSQLLDPNPSSPDRIFPHVAQAPKRPPISPIKSSPAKSAPQQLFSPKLASQSQQSALDAIRSAAEHVEQEESNGGPSPETRDVASVLGGFSQGSRLDFQHEENTQMGVERILGSNDDLSIQRLIEAGTAESNFVGDRRGDGSAEHPPQSPTKPNELPQYQVHDGEASGLSAINGDEKTSQGKGGERKSILSSVMEKTKESALKRKSAAAFPSTPQKQKEVASEGYPVSVPTSLMSFNLGTPGKEEGMGLSSTPAKGELTMNQEFFEYFMSDKSRGATTPGRAGTMSPAKASAMAMSPIKLGNMAPPTPLAQFEPLGGVSGPMEGCNSLMASDFDAVAALKDLSNSAPNTPSKILRPRDESLTEEAVPYHREGGKEEESTAKEAEEPERKKPRTSLFGQVKAKVDGRKP